MNEQNQVQEEQGMTISELLLIFRKHIIAIIVSTIVGAFLGIAYSFGIAKEEYKSSCTIMVQISLNSSASSSTQTDITNSLRIVATIADFIKNDAIAEQAAAQLNNPEITAATIRNGLDVDYSTSSLNITITFTDTNKAIVDDVVNEVIDSAQDIANNTRNSAGDYYYPVIRNTISKVGTATEPKYASPNKPLIVLVTIFAGLIVGCAIGFLRELLDTSIKSKNQVETLSGLKVIGMIPNTNYSKSSKQNGGETDNA